MVRDEPLEHTFSLHNIDRGEITLIITAGGFGKDPITISTSDPVPTQQNLAPPPYSPTLPQTIQQTVEQIAQGFHHLIPLHTCHHMKSLTNNAQTLIGLYQAFSQKNIPEVLAKLAPNISWLDQTGTPRTKGGIEGHYEGHAGVMQFFGKLSGNYKYTVYDPYEFTTSDDGFFVIVAGHDAGTYADTGDHFVTEWNHLWQFDQSGMAVMMRACNGEQVNQTVDWDHSVYRSPTLNHFEKERAMHHVRSLINHFAHQEYHLIPALCTEDILWLDEGRVLPGHNTSGIYYSHAGLQELFMKYQQFYRFYQFNAVRFMQSTAGSVIWVQGNDSGVFVANNGGVSSEWNHIFYISDHHELISKVRFISGELVASTQ